MIRRARNLIVRGRRQTSATGQLLPRSMRGRGTAY